MPVFQLIYRSKANSFFTDEDLITLLKKARLSNAQKNITGLLLYGYGSFTQILEGKEDAVRDLYFNRISKDTRHSNLVVLQQAEVPKRMFQNWSMAFQPLDAEKVREINGYTDPAAKPENGKNLLAPLRLLDLVQSFSFAMNK